MTGAELKQLRDRLGLTQAEMGKQHLGRSRASVGRYEKMTLLPKWLERTLSSISSKPQPKE